MKVKRWVALDAIIQHNDITSKIVYYNMEGINCQLSESYDSDSDFECVDDLLFKCYKNDISKVYVYDFTIFQSYLNYTLLHNGFESTKSMTLRPGQFSEFSLNGTSYSIKICLNALNSTKTAVIEFISALNLLRTPIDKLNKSYCYNIYKYSETMQQIDDNSFINKDNIEKCNGTSKIISEALKSLYEEVGLGASTIGKIAFNTYKNMLDKNDNFDFDSLFPALNENEYNAVCSAYRGGYTYLNKKYENIEIGCGRSYDINSLFIYKMKTEAMPYGKPEYRNIPVEDIYVEDIKEDDIDDFGLYHVEFYGGNEDEPYAILKPRCLPCFSEMSKNIRSCGTLIKNEYKDHINELDGWLTGVDFKMILKRYEFTGPISVTESYIHKSQKGMFDEYIDKFYKMKQESTGGKREVSKMLCNNLHGKFGTRKGGKRDYSTIEGGKVKRIHENNDKDTFSYPAVSVWANAFARKQIIEDGEKYLDRLIAIDTDSLHIEGLDDVDLTISNELGDYKIEDEWVRAKYIKMKTYIHEHSDKTLDIKMCGATPAVKRNIKTFEQFVTGSEFDGLHGIKELDGGKIRVNLKYSLTGSKLKIR